MKRFIIIDEFTHAHQEVRASSMEEAVEMFKRQVGGLDGVKVVKAHRQHNLRIPGVVTFVDEITDEGWGYGCKYEGSSPPSTQLIVNVFER